jgi:hypothetical protein
METSRLYRVAGMFIALNLEDECKVKFLSHK